MAFWCSSDVDTEMTITELAVTGMTVTELNVTELNVTEVLPLLKLHYWIDVLPPNVVMKDVVQIVMKRK